MDPAMRGGPQGGALVRVMKQETRPAGKLPYSDAAKKQYIYVFSLHAEMDWRKVGVLIGRICEAPGFDGKVEKVVWRRVEDVPTDLDMPLVDVQMSGLLFVSWEPEQGAETDKTNKKTGTKESTGTRER